MFKIDWLNSLHMVVKHGNFTEAARIMDCTPMALSKHVSLLEALVGQPLLRRTTRVVTLTEFGGEFLERADSILNESESLVNWVRSRDEKPEGTIRLLGHEHSSFLLITPWIHEFLELHPEVKIEIDYVTNEINVAKHTFDIAWGVSGYLGVKYPGLVAKKLFDMTHGIYSSPSYISKHGEPRSPSELAKLDMLGHPRNKPSNRLLAVTKDNIKDELPYVDMKNSINSTVGNLDLVVNGCGISNFATCSREVQDQIIAGRLVPILEDFWWTQGASFMYWHKVKGDQPKIRAFIDFFVPKLQQWLAEIEQRN